MASNYEDLCRSHGVAPLAEIQRVAKDAKGALELNPQTRTLADLDIFYISNVLSKGCQLKSLSISQQTLSNTALQYLSRGLQTNSSLKSLSLTFTMIAPGSGFSDLVAALVHNQNIERLDFSHNKINDQAVTAICEVIESNSKLKELNLEYNLIYKTSFAFSLVRNETLERLSLSYNPLSFDNLMSLLEMLMNNRGLAEIDLQGVHLDGPAPIKENCHGHLTSKEAVILKLASVLRYSVLRGIGIDLDLASTVQLQELESTLIKHNRVLLELRCEGLNWSAPLPLHLANIQKALKANRVLAECDDTGCIPGAYPELEEILSIKANCDRSNTHDSFANVGDVSESMGRSRQLRSINSSKIFQSIDSPSTIVTSPDQALILQGLSGDYMDFKGPVSAETPQFSNYPPPQRRFVNKQAKLEELMEFETPEGLRRTPSPLGVTVTMDSDRYRNETQLGGQLGQLHSALKILDQEVTRHLGNISTRQNALEDRLMGVQSELSEVKLNDTSGLRQKLERVENSSTSCLSKTQRVLQSLEERLKGLEGRLERDPLSEQVFRELESLRAAQRVQVSRVESLSQSIESSEVRETLMKLNDTQTQLAIRVENLASQLTSQRSKLDLSDIFSDLSTLQKHQEEDRSNAKSYQLRLEIQEAETARLTKMFKSFQKEVFNKVAKLELVDRSESQAYGAKHVDRKFKNLEVRLGAVEEGFNRWEHDSVGSLPSSARNSVLKENATVQKEPKDSRKLNEVHEKISELNRRLERFEELITNKLTQTPAHLEETLTRCLTKSPYPERKKPVERCLARDDFSYLRAYDMPIDKSFEGPIVCRKELANYLPREAESVVLNALIDRSNHCRLSETLRPRSVSTIHARGIEVPSRELTDSLRKRGFEIGERVAGREVRLKH